MKPHERTPRVSGRKPDLFDVLSAAWVMASNDENALMTYESIKKRLNLTPDYPIKEIIGARGDLFRKGVNRPRLDKWREEMLVGGNLPSWIRDIENPEDRQNRINNLTPDDVFRSQFRAKAGAPKSDIKIIDWGLLHINRLRRAYLEAREMRMNRWQLWLVSIGVVVNVILTLVSLRS